MKYITLPNKQLTIVDDDDFETFSQFNWCLMAGYVSKKSSRNTSGSRKTVYLHRLIKKAPNGTVVDHINGDKLDNRKINLRVCTYSNNAHNQTKLNSRNKSGYKGVCNVKGKWKAQIALNKKVFHLGFFETKESASLAYQKAAKEMHGEYSNSLLGV